MLNQELIDKAINWFESMGYHAEERRSQVYLECEGFSVELSEGEVESRAEQWDSEQSRDDDYDYNDDPSRDHLLEEERNFIQSEREN